ncbi:carbohydrate-binding domain-containing protein [Methanolobus sediminis]|uniref:Carbohydrate-binding domain-containing protein n=1 Tax=Methanolobus sediminis TaxID=3072978 RepID=A0AA51UJZ4_9EURY|nr:carbohydrate-binding domain-containing protein [Methanolobus sediminis]WMW24810.1 carbohydrate-binding domain-containing protein [Methanolobus sediminis]
MKKYILIGGALLALLLIFLSSGGSIVSTITEESNNDLSGEGSIVSTITGESNDDISIYSASSEFTDRDLEQEADLEDATYIEVDSDTDITISEEGVYVISGEATEVTIYVDAPDESKVQIVLDGLNIVNEDMPVIYVKSADKVFITTTDSENYMETAGSFVSDGDTNLDAVIFSKDDLVFNGVGSLEIVSSENGISSKDDLKITGGTYYVTSELDSFEANDRILIYDGTFDVNSSKDAFHCENDEDDSLGNIYIYSGTFEIYAADDGITAAGFIQIDGGNITITKASEGIEATYIVINDCNIDIYATDDGINAARKSTAYDVEIVINGGTINIEMASGDTDGIDANGTVTINDGYITITCNSGIDVDEESYINGGTVIVNGVQIYEIQAEMMDGGGMHGGGNMPPGGGMPR